MFGARFLGNLDLELLHPLIHGGIAGGDDLGGEDTGIAAGTPGGICTIANKESSPPASLVSIGMAITGNIVNDATTPARCAAPPAPAITTRSPRWTAVREYSATSSGVRCALITRASQRMPNSSQASAAFFIVGQSVSLPIRIPTRIWSVVLMKVSLLRGIEREVTQNAFQLRPFALATGIIDVAGDRQRGANAQRGA